MKDRVAAAHVHRSELEQLDVKVARDGGSLHYLEGAQYGLVTSVFESEIVPGSGPPFHTHPYAEFFVLIEGRGRYTLEGTSFEAGPGDVVIIPPNVVHTFTNIGSGPLRHTAIHESPVQTAALADGSDSL